jgi:hypothetical protein
MDWYSSLPDNTFEDREMEAIDLAARLDLIETANREESQPMCCLFLSCASCDTLLKISHFDADFGSST